jgi:hypothetical protein
MSQPQREPDRLVELAAIFARALREMEDLDDARDADAAWEESGESIPLADLETEFGHS